MKVFIPIIVIWSLSVLHLQGQNTVGVITYDSLAMSGYTLFTPNTSTYLIDNCGQYINHWESNSRPGLTAYLTEEGNLIRAGSAPGEFNGAGSGGLLEEYNWDGELLWSYKVSNSEYQQHHDIEILPNGNILFIAWEYRSEEEANAQGAASDLVYWPPVVYEIKKLGKDSAEFVWEWHVWDHLIQDHNPEKENFGVVSEHPELININVNASQGISNPDWMHMNGIDYDVLRDEIILSSRNFSEIYIIDHSTTIEEAAAHTGGTRGKGGDILYRWGNPNTYDKGFNEERQLFGQHNAEIVPTGFIGEGNITLFNNGNQRPQGKYSSIDEIRPPRDVDGNYILGVNGVYGPENVTWHYTAPDKETFYSSKMGGTKRLPNGNTLICDSRKGRFFEVTQEGELVWDYESPVSFIEFLIDGEDNDGLASSFRAERIPLDFPAFQNKDITPGEVLELEPAAFDCVIIDVVSSIDDQTDAALLHFKILANRKILISTESGLGDDLRYNVYNQNGQMMSSGLSNDSAQDIDISNYAAGLYFLHCTYKGKRYVKKFINI